MKAKYRALLEHLTRFPHREWHTSFAEIERILGFPFPKSARHYPAWWANEKSGSHSHADSWLEAGWKTENLNLTGEKILFRQVGGTQAKIMPPASKEKPVSLKKEKKPGLPEAVIQTHLRYAWVPVGTVTLDRDRKLVFPKLPKQPGLYRMRIQGDGPSQSYIGETDNLQRRFTHYRNPGPSQATNIRLEKRNVQVIAQGGTVDLAVIISTAWVTQDGKERRADFTKKPERRLFENLTQVHPKTDGINSLNR